ncbi:hypothetical protein BS47DRAFT_1343556 [Hydnum rufescens UP504]|uniref:C2H2-type domain-containing protein n=1 Tax=Hydnum rufescens UP504 TaxID=1448309 RepID=A0A9P6AY81_9AGAM|nr:hypothetical protein BS47DRAFT_1343556 [Hydnum rufescens UP504]
MAATSSAGAKGGMKSAVFVCDICRKNGIDQKYSRIEYLNRHVRTHTEAKPFLCEFCSKRYARSDVLFRHRRKCSLLFRDAQRKSVEAEANSQHQTSLRTTARKNVQPYPALRTSEDAEIPQKTWDDINPHLFSPSVDNEYVFGPTKSPNFYLPSPSGNTPGSVNVLPSEILPIALDQEIALNQTSFGLLNPDSASSLPAYNYNLNEARQSRDDSNVPGLWNEAEAFNTPSIQGWDDGTSGPLEYNPFVTEPTMVLIENNLLRERCGLQRLEPTNSFYLDPQRIMLCYMMPTWDMPNVTRLSALACRTFNSILEHMGIVHMPTFRLSDTHTWIAFAMCTIAPRPGSDLRTTPPATNIGETALIRNALEDMDKSPGWARTQDTICREETDLLVKCFYQTVRGPKPTTEDNLPLIHSLLLYNSSSFLSENHSERLAGELYLGVIISVARRSGLFNPGAHCSKPSLAPMAQWENNWKTWISRESWRRTVWLLYTLDTLASLETGAVIQIPTRDIRHIPLPYANSIWMAPSAEQWCKLTMGHEAAGVTLDDAMYCICHLIMPNQESMLFSTVVGPYGRHVLILTVLRGLIEYGQGKPRGGYVTRRWILSRPADPKPRSPDEIHNHIIFGYRMILDHRGSGHFVHDALPPYWLCRALLDYLTPLPPPHVPALVSVEDSVEEEEDGPNRLADLDLRAMLNVARQFVSNGEGLGIPAPPSPVPQDPFANLFGVTG